MEISLGQMMKELQGLEQWMSSDKCERGDEWRGRAGACKLFLSRAR